jgi:thymidylate kinase
MKNQFSYNTPEEPFLRKLFTVLNKNGIRYAVLRNYDTLPYSLNGSDLDLWVHAKNKDKFLQIVRDKVLAEENIILGEYCSGMFAKYSLIGFSPSMDDTLWGTCLDVNFGIGFRGASYLDDDVFEKWISTNKEGIYVVEEKIAAILGLLKELLNNNHLDYRYRNDAEQALITMPGDIEKMLGPWAHGISASLKNIINIGSKDGCLKESTSNLRSRLFWTNFKKNPVEYLIAYLRTKLSKCKRYLRPPGHVLALHGVDGAGKTTVIESFIPTFAAATHNTYEIKHLRPTLLPPLSRLKGKDTSAGPTLDPHGSNPSGFLISLFRLFYLWLDYQIGYWIKLRPKLGKSPTVLIFDRYYQDIFVDPRRFRIKLPRWIIRSALALLPKPNFSICLHAPVDVILSRKQELPQVELERQTALWKEYAASRSNVALISTDAPIEEVRDRVLGAFMDYLKKR